MAQQPEPTSNNEPHIQQIIISDWHDRYAHGVATYGTGLQVGNGRNPVQDSIEEVMDLHAYLVQIGLTWDRMRQLTKHILELHVADSTQYKTSNGQVAVLCTVCRTPMPCHTRIDLDLIINLLGDVIPPSDNNTADSGDVHGEHRTNSA